MPNLKAKVSKPRIEVTKCKVIVDSLNQFDHNAFLYVYTVDGVEVRGIHWSGRYDGSMKQLAEHIKYLVDHYNAHYVTTTESQQVGAMKEIRDKLGKKLFKFSRSGEYFFIYRRSTFRRVLGFRPTKRVFTAVPHWALWRQLHVARFDVIHRKTARRFVIRPFHGPSGIENGNEFTREANGELTEQSKVAKQGYPRVGRTMKRMAKVFPARVQIFVGDCNGDLFRVPWMDRFNGWLGCDSTWLGRLPSSGTHGRRLIDGAWIYDAD